MFGMSYTVRVDFSDGYEIVNIEAASIAEALQRARNIWSSPESVKLVGMIDRQPQKALAF